MSQVYMGILTFLDFTAQYICMCGPLYPGVFGCLTPHKGCLPGSLPVTDHPPVKKPVFSLYTVPTKTAISLQKLHPLPFMAAGLRRYRWGGYKRWGAKGRDIEGGWAQPRTDGGNSFMLKSCHNSDLKTFGPCSRRHWYFGVCNV